jgi:hypothetical protein
MPVNTPVRRRRALLRIVEHNSLALALGPRRDDREGITCGVSDEILEVAWKATEAAHAGGDRLGECTAGLFDYPERTPCQRPWAWWEWTTDIEYPGGWPIGTALALSDAGELSEAEVALAIADAEHSLDRIGREVWHGAPQGVRLAEALIEARGLPHLRPYIEHRWDQETETTSMVEVV